MRVATCIALLFVFALPTGVHAQVSPQGTAVNVGANTSTSYSFSVRNSGTTTASFDLSVTCSNAVVSCTTPDIVSIGPNRSVGVTVSYTTGSVGTGEVRLTAENMSTGTGGQGWINVTLPGAAPSLTANDATWYTAENFDTNYPWFHLHNDGNTAAQYSLAVTMCAGDISGCSVRSNPGTIAAGGTADVIVDYHSGAGDNSTGTMTLTATSPYGESTSRTLTVVPLSSAVSVMASGPAYIDSGSGSTIFSVIDQGNSSPVTYSLTCGYTGVVTSCTAPASVQVYSGSPQNVRATFGTNNPTAGGTGTVWLRATFADGVNTYTNQASSFVSLPDTRIYTVSVTPKNNTTYKEQDVATNFPFIVTNSGNATGTYTLTLPVCTGTASGCSFSSSSSVSTTTISVGPNGGTATVYVYYHTGPVGQNAGITLHASGPTNSDDGSTLEVPTAPTVQVIAPNGSPSVSNSSGTYQFHVKNVGTVGGNTTYGLQVTGCSAPLTGCSAPGSIILAQGAESIVTVSFQTQGTSGTGAITLRAYAQDIPRVNVYDDSATAHVVVTSRLAVSTAFMNNDNQNTGLCAASCFAMTAAQSTVPYYTLDTPRSVTLVYNGDRAFPRPFVYADVYIASAPAAVQEYQLRVRQNGVNLTFTNGDTLLHFQGPATPTTTYRLAAQVDMTSYPTGAYPVQVMVTAVYADNTSDATTVNTQLLVVNTQNSSVAKGWTIGGVPRLYVQQSDGSAIITDGTGSAAYFANTGGTFGSPSGDYTTLATLPNGGWVRSALDGTRVWFRTSGLADSVTDRLGFNTRFDYDPSERLVRIYDPMLMRSVGATRAATVLSYSSTSLQSIQEPNPAATNGRITYVHVGANGQLRSVIDPDNDSTSYGYDGSQRLNTITDRNGNTTTYDYGATWQIAQVTAPPVLVDSAGMSATRQPVTTLRSWQSVGVPSTHTDANNRAALVSADTIVARITDPNGYTGSFSVNRWGQAMRSTDPVGNLTNYYRNGILLTGQSVPDGRGMEGWNEYDYSGPYLTMAHQAGSDSSYYHYGANAQVDSTWGPQSVFQQRFLRPDGLPDSVQYAHSPSRVTRYTYDPMTKRVATLVDPAQDSTSYSYDTVFGNLKQTMTPGGGYRTAQFDSYGRDTVTMAPGVAPRYTLFDNVNRAVFDSVAGNTRATRVVYYHDHSTVTDALGQMYRTDFNALGWTIADYHPDAAFAPIRYSYDKGGRLTSTTNRRGQTTTMTYDAIGRVLTRNDPVSGPSMFSYSAGGFSTVASNASTRDSTMVFLYCPTGQYTSSSACSSDTTIAQVAGIPYTLGHTTPGRFDQTTTSSFDDGSSLQRKSMWNVLGRADSVTLGPLTMSYVYGSRDGMRTGTTLSNGATRTDSYTRNHEAYSWTYSDANINALYRRAQRFDPLGRVTNEQMGYPYPSLASNYTLDRQVGYDTMGRVAQVDWSYATCNAWPGSNATIDADSLNIDLGWRYRCVPNPLFSENYQYDAVGNRQDNGMSYHTGNRLYAASSQAFEYDADGNMTGLTNTSTGIVARMYWDAGSQLDSVLVSGSGPGSGQPSYRVDYRYDAYGRQVWRAVTGLGAPSQRVYVYDGPNIGKEVDLVTGNTTEYSYEGVDHPTMSVTRSSAGTVLRTQSYMMDGMGNVVGGVPDSTGSAGIVYDSWGNVQTDSTAVNRLSTLRFGYKGMLYDEVTGLYYARARWYDPGVGRFLSEDPIGLAGGLNQYAFAGDDPINGSDPSGMDPAGLEITCETFSNGNSVCITNGSAQPISGVTVTVPAPGSAPAGPGNYGGNSFGTPEGGGLGGSGGGGGPSGVTTPQAQQPSRLTCVGQALWQNKEGLALDVAGGVAFIAFPEASVGATVAGNTLGVAGLGLAVAKNWGVPDGVFSGTLAVTGKEAALAAYVAGKGTAASKFAGRIGVYGLALSTAVDFGKTVYEYHACRTGN